MPYTICFTGSGELSSGSGGYRLILASGGEGGGGGVKGSIVPQPQPEKRKTDSEKLSQKHLHHEIDFYDKRIC